MFDTKSIDPSLVTFTELKSPGVRKKNRLIIPFSEIYVPSLKSGDGNKVRTHKNIPHIQRLEISFTQGIDYSQMPNDIVIKFYYSALGLLGLYILLRLMYRRKK